MEPEVVQECIYLSLLSPIQQEFSKYLLIKPYKLW